MYLGEFFNDKNTLKPSAIADPNPCFSGLTRRRILLYFLCRPLTISAVLSGLESSITSIETSKCRLSTSLIKLSIFCASQYVGRITPISELHLNYLPNGSTSLFLNLYAVSQLINKYYIENRTLLDRGFLLGRFIACVSSYNRLMGAVLFDIIHQDLYILHESSMSRISAKCTLF